MALRIIQVGLGGFGTDWARLLRTAPDLVEVVASVEIVPEGRTRFATAFGDAAGDVFADLGAALTAHPEADAVLVTTPVGAHLPVAREAVAAGRHVLVEKPFAPDAAAAAAFVDEADAAGVTVGVSQNYRWYPAPIAVRALLDSGEHGAVGAVTVRFRKWANDPRPPGHRHFALRHPLLVDMAVHHLDLMRTLFGEPRDVVCRAWNPPWSRFDEPAEAAALIRFGGGVTVDYSGSWVSSAPETLWGGRWTIETETGLLEFVSRDGEGTDSDAVWFTPRGGTREALDLPSVRWTDRLGSVAELARAVAAGDEPSISGRENLGTLAFLDAVVASADSGGIVTVAG